MPPGDDGATDPPEPLRLVHHHPGRLRLRAEAFRAGAGPRETEKLPARAAGRGTDEAALRPALQRALAALRAHAGVTRIAHSPFTGSLLIEYQPGRVEPGALLASVAAAAGLSGVVDEESMRRHHFDAAVAVVRGLGQANRATRELTGGRADLRTLVPAGLFAGALFSLFRRPLLPRWDNLLYWSYTMFRDLNTEVVQRIRDEAGDGGSDDDLEDLEVEPKS
jgi:heavy-metal-associated domain-containing protein